MHCLDVYRFICDNLDASIESPKCRAIRKHLAECPNCMAYLTSLKQTVKLYSLEPVPRLTRAIHSRLMHVLNQKCLDPPPKDTPDERSPSPTRHPRKKKGEHRRS